MIRSIIRAALLVALSITGGHIYAKGPCDDIANAQQKKQCLKNEQQRAQQQQQQQQAQQRAQQQQQQAQQRQQKPTQSQDPCAKYYGRGYCTDYIQERVGRKPPGDAGAWPGNTPVSNIRVGDAAIFSVGSAGHVAYVEQVITDKATGKPIQIRISEKNWGRVLPGEENQRCVITSNFGKTGTRTVPVTSVAKVWRP